MNPKGPKGNRGPSREPQDDPVAQSGALERALDAVHPSTRRRRGVTVTQVLCEHGAVLRKADVEAVLRELQHRWRDGQGTLEAFRWMKRQRWFRPNVKFYNGMMAFLARSGEAEAALALFQEMLLDRLPMDDYSYTALIHAFGRGGQFDDALAVLHHMKTSPNPQIRPNAVTCNVLLKILCEGRRYSDVADLFLDMFYGLNGLHSPDCRPSIVTFNTLLGALCREGMLDAARKMLEDLRNGRLDPPDLALSAPPPAASAPAAAEAPTAAQPHRWVRPNVAKHGTVADISEGTVPPPDPRTPATSSSSAPAGRTAAEAPSTTHRQRYHRRVRPNVVTYNMLVDAFGKAERVDVAEQIVDLMRQESAEGGPGEAVAPDQFTYTALLDAYGRLGVVEKAEEIFRLMEDEGVTPDLHAYTALIMAYSRAGLPHLVNPIVARLRAAGLTPNEVTYPAIVDAYGKAGAHSLAEATLREMQAAGVRPSVHTWSSLVDAYGRAGQWGAAIATFRRMQEEGGCRPNPITYSALLSACARCERWEDALKIVYSLQRSGSELEVVLCRLLLGGREEESRAWADAARLLGALETVYPREVQRSLYNTLADALWSFGMRRRARRLVRLGMQRGVFPGDRVAYGAPPPQGSRAVSHARQGPTRRQAGGREQRGGSVWSVDLHEHSLGSGTAFLYSWLQDLRQLWKWDESVIPEAVEVITGWGRHNRSGDSPLKRLVVAELQALGSPFAPLSPNPGRLVASGWAVFVWLQQEEMEELLQLVDSALPAPSGDVPPSGHAPPPPQKVAKFRPRLRRAVRRSDC